MNTALWTAVFLCCLAVPVGILAWIMTKWDRSAADELDDKHEDWL